MNIINVDNIFLVSLWKLSVEEVINNRHYNFPDNITKIALTLPDKRLLPQEEDLLELHDWLVIEVEPILVDASAEELENYIQSHFNEIVRTIKEYEIINPEKEESNIPFIVKDDDSLDSFLNTD